MPSEPPSRWLPYLLLTLTVLFWSGNFVLGRGIRELIPPVSLNFWRWTGALVILLPFGLPRVIRQWSLVRAHWLLLAAMSIPAISIFNTFIYLALQTATSTNTVLINTMIPIFIGLTGRIAFGERMRRLQVVGVFVSMTGLLFIISDGDLSMIRHLTFSKGDLWTLAAGISWAVYSVMLRLRPVAMHPLTFLTAIVVLGLLFLLPFYLWEFFLKGGFPLSGATMASISYLCIFPSVLSYIFWNHGVQMVGAARAGIFIHLMPALTILIAALFLGERLHGYHLAGMALIFSGIVLVSRPQCCKNRRA